MKPRLFLLVVAVVAATTSQAADAATRVDLRGSIAPVIREVPQRPAIVTLKVEAHFRSDDAGDLPAILDRSIVHFPYGSALNNRLFPSCRPAAINRRGTRACPRGSRIGGGHAIGVGDNVRQRLVVSFFNGPRGRSIIFHLRGNNPLRVNTAFEAPLNRLRGGRWNYRLTIPVPENLQVVAGVPLALEEFVSTVHASRRINGRRRGFIEAWACPPGARLPLRGSFAFLEGPPVLVDSWLGCG